MSADHLLIAPRSAGFDRLHHMCYNRIIADVVLVGVVLRSRMINADKPHLWKQDIAASVDYFNRWFIDFAPETFRNARAETVNQVEKTFRATNDLRNLTLLKQNPEALSNLRMCTAPPLAADRLIGLAGVSKHLINTMERGKLPARMAPALLDGDLTKLCNTLIKLLDRDIFPWLNSGANPTDQERDRAAAIV
ncbi:MAG: hypothetical protein C0183_00725 [Roseiflexus castenholzii]|uniref:XamI family restriction endonuclease n=1 Tax=Roseiflexus castenholzii TaxID=120962 RepID=UPI000CB27FFD|nr:MAG: hypothetical protein C0183_00725 [Roseiflexus castenholzii]